MMTGQRITFGQGQQRRAMGAADADPVLRRDFQKVEIAHTGRREGLSLNRDAGPVRRAVAFVEGEWKSA